MGKEQLNAGVKTGRISMAHTNKMFMLMFILENVCNMSGNKCTLHLQCGGCDEINNVRSERSKRNLPRGC